MRPLLPLALLAALLAVSVPAAADPEQAPPALCGPYDPANPVNCGVTWTSHTVCVTVDNTVVCAVVFVPSGAYVEATEVCPIVQPCRVTVS